MEWTTFQYLDLRHVGVKLLQPHVTSFHPHEALIVFSIRTYIIEFDALTGSKIFSLDIGALIVCMSYSPTSGHIVIAILQSSDLGVVGLGEQRLTQEWKENLKS
ncbi:hypothetical protein VNO77_35431 [Canavalia gladiata]|uniref:Uncharacterized protein n=1 Tax=Canavalia gladiata TaxID=3824 RepID=A0AAN9Q2B8_CANGL